MGQIKPTSQENDDNCRENARERAERLLEAILGDDNATDDKVTNDKEPIENDSGNNN